MTTLSFPSETGSSANSARVPVEIYEGPLTRRPRIIVRERVFAACSLGLITEVYRPSLFLPLFSLALSFSFLQISCSSHGSHSQMRLGGHSKRRYHIHSGKIKICDGGSVKFYALANCITVELVVFCWFSFTFFS